MNAADMLEEAGFKPLEAADADAALALLEQFHGSVQVLFTDVQMPGSRDGFSLARHIAAVWPHIGIVVASGQMRPRDDDLPSGAVFIAKPFSVEVVHDHLRKILA